MIIESSAEHLPAPKAQPEVDPAIELQKQFNMLCAALGEKELIISQLKDQQAEIKVKLTLLQKQFQELNTPKGN